MYAMMFKAVENASIIADQSVVVGTVATRGTL